MCAEEVMSTFDRSGNNGGMTVGLLGELKRARCLHEHGVHSPDPIVWAFSMRGIVPARSRAKFRLKFNDHTVGSFGAHALRMARTWIPFGPTPTTGPDQTSTIHGS